MEIIISPINIWQAHLLQESDVPGDLIQIHSALNLCRRERKEWETDQAWKHKCMRPTVYTVYKRPCVFAAPVSITSYLCPPVASQPLLSPPLLALTSWYLQRKTHTHESALKSVSEKKSADRSRNGKSFMAISILMTRRERSWPACWSPIVFQHCGGITHTLTPAHIHSFFPSRGWT